MTKKTILFVCRYMSVYGGNFIPSLIELEERLLSAGHKIIYVFPDEAKDREWYKYMIKSGKAIKLISFDKGKKHLINDLSSIIKNYKVNIVHSHHISSYIMERISLRNRKTKFFVHLHSDFSSGKKSFKEKVINYLIYAVLGHCVNFICVSEDIAKMHPNARCIPNALALKRIPSEHKGREFIRNEYNVSDETILCEIFGWSPYVKGVDIAVEAIKMLNENKGIDIKLAIVCGRQYTAGKMAEWINEHTTCTGTENYLIFLPPTEDVFSYHDASDLLLSTSRSEGFSYAILEMLSIGKSCVISEIPGVLWSKEYETVCSFKSENTDDCANTISKLIPSCKKTNEFVAYSVKEKYNIFKWTEDIVNLYAKG